MKDKWNKPTINIIKRTFCVIATFVFALLIYEYCFGKTEIIKEGRAFYTTSLTSDNVTCFEKDDEDRIWIGTKNGLNIFNNIDLIQFYNIKGDSSSIPNNYINCIFNDHSNHLWIGTNNGIARYMHNMTFQQYYVPGSNNDILQIIETSDGRIIAQSGFSLYVFKNGHFERFIDVPGTDNYWFTHQLKLCTDDDGGIWEITPTYSQYYDKNGKQGINIPLNRYANLCCVCNDKDRIWIAQSRNICCLDKKTKKIVYHTNNEISILPSIITKDNDGNIILKSHKYGLYKLYLRQQKVMPLSRSELPLKHNEALISTMKYDKEGVLWIGYDGVGFEYINRFGLQERRMNQLPIGKETQGHNITCLSQDNTAIWGSIDSKIFRYLINTEKYDQWEQDSIFTDSPYFRQELIKILPINHNIVCFLTNVRIALCTSGEKSIHTIKMYNPGKLLSDCAAIGDNLFVVYEGNKILKANSNRIDSINIKTTSYNDKSKLVPLSKTKLLIVNENLSMAILDVNFLKVKELNVKRNNKFNNLYLRCIYKDKKNRIWIGTNREGLLRLDINKIQLENEHITTQDNEILNISEDKYGQLWLTSHKNIYIYNPDKREGFSYMNSSINNARNPYNEKSITQYRDIGMVLGTRNGCTIIPLQKTKKNHSSNIKIKKIEILNNNDEQYAIANSIKDKDRITLEYDKNDINITFGDVNFSNSLSYIYDYKLDGFDNSWHNTDRTCSISYPNLSPGSYKFIVRAKMLADDAIAKECEVTIRILPPIWISWQAIVIYTIVLSIIVFNINRLYLREKYNKMALDMKANEVALEKQTNEMNMKFFANISHEFRNPLTMISGPITLLKRDTTLPNSVQHTLSIISLSVNRLLELIDQMLDFNKLENDVLELRVSLCDISNEMRKEVEIFNETTKLHSINLEVSGINNSRFIWVDVDKLSKIMDNLLTNALKHTPEYGTIGIGCKEIIYTEAVHLFNCQADKISSYMMFSVSNSGKSIPENKISSVFKRYYQVKEVNESHNYGFGSGLGLYYVEQLIKLHKGGIRVDNLKEGGVIFRFILPVGNDIYSDNEKLKEEVRTENYNSQKDIKISTSKERNEITTLDDRIHKKVLVVDDDTNMAMYLHMILGNDYSVENRYSAESALEYLKDEIPDIILSDVMMNEMSGLEFCKILKSDISYSHIPIILITAKSNIKEQIEGLSVGAIGYVVKPFDPDYLLALVCSQLKNMDELKSQLSESIHPNTNVNGLSPQDKAFIEELYRLMEKQIGILELNLTSICEEMRISRTKFNYKMKSLTGMTPNNFFMQYKLNRAAKMLRDSQYNVSEIALQTGFNSTSYFSVTFKKHFGVSPSDFK